MFTAADHEKLELALDLVEWAQEIVGEVLDQHPMDMTAQLLLFMTSARDHAGTAGREIKMADRYTQWKEDAA